MSDQVGLKIEKFSGEKNDWKLWAELFKARLMTKGLLDVINVKPEAIPTRMLMLRKRESRSCWSKILKHTWN